MKETNKDHNDAREPLVLTWEEQSRLLQALPDYLAIPVLFALNTGLREQEVLSLKWEELETDDRLGEYCIRETSKNGKKFPIVLNHTAHRILDSLRGNRSEYIFLNATGRNLKTINKAKFQIVRRDLHLKHRVHDLRHTFAHRLRVAEVPFEDIQVLMGHVNKTMTEHYAQADILHLLECVRRIEQPTESVTLRGLR